MWKNGKDWPEGNKVGSKKPGKNRVFSMIGCDFWSQSGDVPCELAFQVAGSFLVKKIALCIAVNQ